MANLLATGDSLAGLQTTLENYFAVGERATVAIALGSELSAEQMADIRQNLVSGGVRLHGLAQETWTWTDDQPHPVLVMTLERPAMAPADKIGAWEMFLALGAVAVIGYAVFKATDLLSQLSPLILPLALIGGVVVVAKEYVRGR